MHYLNLEIIRTTDPRAFRNQHPWPWMNPQGFLTPQGFEELLTNMPDLSLFEPFFGLARKYGPKSHDRYVLEYQDGLDVPASWQAFIDELRSNVYRGFIKNLLGRGHFRFRFHWHYTPGGCMVSPHCDSKGKLGSHIFYMNSRRDWDPAWGGATVILDDRGDSKQDLVPHSKTLTKRFPPRR